MSYLLNNTSAQDLDSTIRCAIGNNRPFEIEREISRQERLK